MYEFRMGIGFTEMVIIGTAFLAIVVPRRFPDVVTSVVQTIRELRAYVDHFKMQVGQSIWSDTTFELNPDSQADRVARWLLYLIIGTVVVLLLLASLASRGAWG